MLKTLLRHILPLAVLGALTLSSCVVHERGHDQGHRGRDHGGYGRGRGRGY